MSASITELKKVKDFSFSISFEEVKASLRVLLNLVLLHRSTRW
jgi:hypothetical protein